MKRSWGLAYFVIAGAAACGGDSAGPDLSPTVTAVAPDRGPLAGGTSVTLTGKNFTDITGVTFGGTPLQNVTAVSATQITGVTAQGHAAGPQEVVVTSSTHASGHCAGCFSYTQFPGPLALRLLTNRDSAPPPGAVLIRVEGGALSGIQAAGSAVPWSSTTTPAYLIVSGSLSRGTFLATIMVADTQVAVRDRFRASIVQAAADRANNYRQLNAGDYSASIERVSGP
jgi:IPT/TIG domain-containing protein